ncbi:TonB-dependent hemoglobin/transferrin/lactoferrin family receptor [Chitinasiproducens palmae]|uniref:Hemoglobin/transferrin/lactoferrin receptor protein n=1 Tax=Chitinasiproducens palmae TaxID=1770053 RepID=A0A1H2PQT6_9BURK|nr:TonB-dependent hemoglobin/transferrin/lactoferrin family receptor [Chitinasiproducens palmae]SDV48791.1 hemoglobin/transferrin/lactoferrin receptor protein [Chitinasiproducens palmae]
MLSNRFHARHGFSFATLAALTSLPFSTSTAAETPPTPHPDSTTATVQPALARRSGAAAQVSARLDPVTVTATRMETPESRTPASLSVIDAETLAQYQSQDLKNALRYEPSVSVRHASYRPASAAGGGGRDGNAGVNIRGLEGNRVLLMEDGVRLPYGFTFGPLEAGRGDYADIATLSRIEVLRGPASTLYGSDGLTGAVNFVTRTPAELLAIHGKSSYAALGAGYDSLDRSVGATVSLAGGNDRIQAMVIADGRRGHERRNKGDDNSASTARTAPNPQDTYAETLLGKLVLTPGRQDTVTLTAETVRRRLNSDVLSAVRPPTTLALIGNDRLERNRYSVRYDRRDPDTPWLQRAHMQLYLQDASQRQYAFETRGRAASRSRVGRYDERTLGGSVLAESRFVTGALAHTLVYGADGSVDRITNLRDGTVPGVGEPPFPNKAFPDTDYVLFGAFLQDSVRYGALAVTPGLRFDVYRLNVSTGDPRFVGDAVPSHASTVSPRLTVQYEWAPTAMVYVQYARGFRAPSPDQVNNSFANPLFGYTTIGNPHLKPETSDAVELGVRGRLGTGAGPLHYQAAVFAGNYHDFISQRVVRGSGRPGDPMVFQNVNVARARLHGLEGRVEWLLPRSVTFKAAMAFTRGTVRSDDGKAQPLDTVNPLTAVLGLRYEPSTRWFAQADVLFQAAKRASDVTAKSCAGQDCFLPPSSMVVDLHAGYRFSQHVVGYVGIDNLFDRRYWTWSDVRGIAETSAVTRAYTAPGRSVSVSLKVDF